MAIVRISATIGDEKTEMTKATNSTFAEDVSIIVDDANFRAGGGFGAQTSQIMRLLERALMRMREELQSGNPPG